jgi:hypothetical protein
MLERDFRFIAGTGVPHLSFSAAQGCCWYLQFYVESLFSCSELFTARVGSSLLAYFTLLSSYCSSVTTRH